MKQYEKYISSLEEDNERLKKENDKLRSQVDFIKNIPEDRLDDLTNLISEFKEVKERYDSAIGAAREAKNEYENALYEVTVLKQELMKLRN